MFHYFVLFGARHEIHVYIEFMYIHCFRSPNYTISLQSDRPTSPYIFIFSLCGFFISWILWFECVTLCIGEQFIHLFHFRLFRFIKIEWVEWNVSAHLALTCTKCIKCRWNWIKLQWIHNYVRISCFGTYDSSIGATKSRKQFNQLHFSLTWFRKKICFRWSVDSVALRPRWNVADVKLYSIAAKNIKKWIGRKRIKFVAKAIA